MKDIPTNDDELKALFAVISREPSLSAHICGASESVIVSDDHDTNTFLERCKRNAPRIVETLRRSLNKP